MARKLATRAFRQVPFVNQLSLEGQGRWLLSSSTFGARLMDASTGAPLYQHGHGVGQTLVAGRWLVVTTSQPLPELLLVDTADFSTRHRLALGAAPQALAASPDGAWLACWTADGALHQLRVDGETPERHALQRTAADEVALAFSPDGARLAAAYHERKARTCAVELFSSAPAAPPSKGAKAAQAEPAPFVSQGLLKGARSAVHTLAFSPDGAELVACTAGAVLAWRLPNGKARTLLTCKNFPSFVGFHGGAVLLTDAREAIASIALADGAERWRHPHHGPAAMDDASLVHGLLGQLIERDPGTGDSRQQGGADSYPDHLVIDRERGHALVGTAWGWLPRRWLLATGQLEPHPQGWGGEVLSAIVDGERVVVGTREAIHRWGPGGQERHIDRPGRLGPSHQCRAVEPDGDSLWASFDTTVFWWNAATGEYEASSENLREIVVVMHHAADLGYLVVCTSNAGKPGKLLMLNPRTLDVIDEASLSLSATRVERRQGAEIRIFSSKRYIDFDLKRRQMTGFSPDLPYDHDGYVFSPGGDLAARSVRPGEDRSLDRRAFLVHDVATGAALHEPRPMPSVAILAFLDGERLLSVHTDALRGWCIASGEQLFEVPCETFAPSGVWVAAGGRRALVAGLDGSCDLHDLPG